MAPGQEHPGLRLSLHPTARGCTPTSGKQGWVVTGFRAQAPASQGPSLTLSPRFFLQTVTCFFTISTDPWRTKFDLLNDTCLEGHQ